MGHRVEPESTLNILEAAQTPVADTLKSVPAPGTVETRAAGVQTAVTEKLVRRVSWEEAVKICPRLAYDRDAAMSEANRWGLPKFLSISPEDYTKQFEIDMPLPEVEAIKNSGNSFGLFTPRFENTRQALDILILGAKIPLFGAYEQDNYARDNMDKVHMVDVHDFPAYELARMRAKERFSDEDIKMILSFSMGAYHGFGSRVNSPASVLYTPNSVDVYGHSEPPVKNVSAFGALGRGKHLNGAAYFMLIRKMLDIGLAREMRFTGPDSIMPQIYHEQFKSYFAAGKLNKYMPDQDIWTLFPADVYPTGGVLRICWRSQVPALQIDCDIPSRAGHDIGLRPAFGSYFDTNL